MILSLADVVWPSMVLLNGLWTWWVILAGLLIELVFLRLITDLTFKRLLLADLLMNLASSLCGAIPIIIGGLGESLLSGLTIERYLHLGTFNPYSWAGTFLVAVLVNTAIEALVIVSAFRQRLKWWGYFLLGMANACSVGLAVYEVIQHPPRM